jgi:hypothetical protein
MHLNIRGTVGSSSHRDVHKQGVGGNPPFLKVQSFPYSPPFNLSGVVVVFCCFLVAITFPEDYLFVTEEILLSCILNLCVEVDSNHPFSNLFSQMF